jgi:predicted phosphodiesterase
MSENPFELPESYKEEYEPYHCPFYDNWLVMSDIHVPYHDIGAISELINYGIEKNIKAILINGDFLDCYQLSKFNPDPRKRNLSEEMEAGIELLKSLQKYTGAKIFFKSGNHEERLENILIRQAPFLLGIPDFELDKLLRLEQMGIEYIKDQRRVYIGKLAVIHGHEVRLVNTIVNPARTLFLKAKRSTMCGHLHVPSMHTGKSLDDKIISCWSTGHLGDPHPRYARNNEWIHGGARVEVDAEGNFEVVNLRLIHNKLYRA